MVKIREYMTEDVVSFTPETKVSVVIDEFVKTRHDGFPILDGDQVVGIITLHNLIKAKPKQKVAEVMEINVVTGSPDDDLVSVAGVMAYNQFHHLPITENGILVGIVTGTDILRACIENLISENVEKVFTIFKRLHRGLHMTHGIVIVESLIPTQRNLDFHELKLREDEFDRSVIYPIIVARNGDIPYIVDGHHRAFIARERGMPEIPAFFIEGEVGIVDIGRKLGISLKDMELLKSFSKNFSY